MSAYGSPFAGLNISVGGSLSRTVFEYTKLIKDKGGNVSNVVTEKVRFLCGDSDTDAI